MHQLLKQIKNQVPQGQRWIFGNCQYLTIHGSEAFAVNQDTSDLDVYGFTIPPYEYIFPYEDKSKYVRGLDTQTPTFDQMERNGLEIQHNGNNKILDITIYGIVRYFKLCGDCNPNMIDSLFTNTRCHMHTTVISEHILAHKELFLSKKAWHTYKGYAYSQLHKLSNKKYENSHKRKTYVEKYGYDVKAGYHVVRLLDEIQQILENQTIDLTRAREHMKAVRKGEVSLEDLTKWSESEQVNIAKLYAESPLRNEPDWDALRKLLLECLELYYGNMQAAEKHNTSILEEIKNIITKYED